VHEFFRNRGFFYVHTPIITASDCEGAGAMFEVQHHSSELDSSAADSMGRYFFGDRAYLSVSGQLQAESYATALSKVYTFGPTFRAENSNTPRHLAEFWMIEPEMAFYDLSMNINLAYEFIRYVVHSALERCESDLAFLHSRPWAPSDLSTRLNSLLRDELRVITYDEAIEILKNSGHKFDYQPEWGCDLQTEHERYLTDSFIKGPCVVINYPKSLKPFYMKVNDERTVRAMDVLVPGLGEIIGGSQREDSLEILEERMVAQGLDAASYSWYLDLRRYGTVEHAGFGLGFERLLMYITGMQNIRDVIPFPRYPGHAKC
jgi:asparaginyl-tRNA synthetase